MKLRIGYFADGPWAHEALNRLKGDREIEILFICVRYDKKDEVLVKYAQEYGIDLLMDPNINSEEFLKKLMEYKADLFVSMSFNQIFKEKIIKMPPRGIINCHAGKLPFYRGRNVLNWVLINDEKEFGITVHYVDTGIDTGDIILQETYPITDEDNYKTLLERAYLGCGDVLYRAIRMLIDGKEEVIVQDSIDKVGFYCGMRVEGDEMIDWSLTSREVFNFVRAICLPGPEARTFLKGKEMKINKVKMVEGARPYQCICGMVVGKTDRGFYVKTGDTIVEVTEYSYEGRVPIGSRLCQNGGVK